MYRNRLSGLIPESITAMTSLVELVLQDNRLEGFECIDRLGSSCIFDMPRLQRLDISDNKLGGTLPRQIFHLPALRSVALVNGCFHGNLHDDICLATDLEVLSLDGLTSSPHCRINQPFHPFPYGSGYIVRHYMSGSIPSCIWHMPNLTVLHIAGNGLTGTLPSSLPKDSKLINVSVAFNKISGPIPNDLQEFPFVELCVAYNKLSGVLSYRHHVKPIDDELEDNDRYPQYQDNIGSVISVEVNRLTGYVPQDFEKVETLDALNGNFFMCNKDHPLPENDEQSSYYICGSVNLDQSLIVVAVIAAVIILLFIAVVSIRWSRGRSSAVMYDNEKTKDMICDNDRDEASENLLGNTNDNYKYYSGNNFLDHSLSYTNDLKRSIDKKFMLWSSWFEETMNLEIRREADLRSILSSNDNASPTVILKELNVFISLLCMIRRSSLLLTFIIVVVCTPMYLLLKLVWGDEYSTHTNQYGWLVSSAFLSGIVPAICTLFVFLLLCCVLAYSLVTLYPTSAEEARTVVRLSMLSLRRDSEHFRLSMPGLTNNTVESNINSPNATPDGSFNSSSCVGAFNSSRVTLESSSDGTRDHSYLSYRIVIQAVIFCSIFLFNVIITFSVYALYVYAFDTSTHYYVKLAMKAVLAMFQIGWNLIAVPKAVEHVANMLGDLSSKVKWLTTLCLCFNYIIAPATASLLSSSTCFADYFKEQTSVVSFYSYDICRAYSLEIETNTRFCSEVTSATFSTSFVPPFMYYYQCSSTLITTYVAVLMLEHAMITIIPVTVVVLLSHKRSSNYAPKWFIRSLPSIVWPPCYAPEEVRRTTFRGAMMRPNRMLAAFFSHFVVLITYGAADPYLAIAICMAMCSLTVLVQVLIGRYIQFFRAKRGDHSSDVVLDQWSLSTSEKEVVKMVSSTPPKKVISGQSLQTLNNACKGILNGLPSCLWTVLFIASLFMAAMLTDMASDKVTWTIGIFIGLAAFTAPVLSFGTLKLTLSMS